MKTLIGLLALSLPASAQPQPVMERQLDEAARVASVMVDGDVCRRIVTSRALESMFKTDARDPWIGSDNYDVDHAAFIQTKKTLMRLARLVAFPCDVNLWMPLPSNRVHVVIRNPNEMSQFWTWGALHQEMFAPMKEVLETGRRVTVKQKPGFVSVLAPVYDSLGDIVGLVEAVTQPKPDKD